MTDSELTRLRTLTHDQLIVEFLQAHAKAEQDIKNLVAQANQWNAGELKKQKDELHAQHLKVVDKLNNKHVIQFSKVNKGHFFVSCNDEDVCKLTKVRTDTVDLLFVRSFTRRLSLVIPQKC